MNADFEIIKKLSELAKQGPIKPIGHGPNSVGKTLQSSLGLTHTTASRNSFLGYTISATSSSLGGGARTNLFACVADWNRSPFKSTFEMVNRIGRPDESRGYTKSLFCTVTSLSNNGFGLSLKVQGEELEEYWVASGKSILVAKWDPDKLKAKLEGIGKHVLVQAQVVKTNSERRYHFRYAEILSEPDPNMFFNLLESGSITVDHLIALKAGAASAVEKGPLFKIRSDAKKILHPSCCRVDLLDY
jgi:hypothetical protein